MIQLTAPQQATVNKCRMILYEKGVVYVAGEPRTGKTPISISLAKVSGWKRICIVTTKASLPGIEKFVVMEPELTIDVVVYNIHNVKKIGNFYDGYIMDEAHKLGAYSKPGAIVKVMREKIGIKPVILMSGTPSPESKSQLYHQFWVTKYGPFVKYKNFIQFAKDLVEVKKEWRNGWMINNYDDAKGEAIDALVKPYMITLSQIEAGIESVVEEKVLIVNIRPEIYTLIKILKRDKVYTLKSGHTIVADTPVRRQMIAHQLCSGTIKIDEHRQTLDDSKARFILDYFQGKKIAIYYKFIQEFAVLQEFFPNWTSDIAQFNNNKNYTFLKQLVSGREGVDLSTADALVAYNIDFSATTYFQMRARMQNIHRKESCPLYFIFSERGIEHKIYEAVNNKKDFTVDYFKAFEKDISAQLALL